MSCSTSEIRLGVSTIGDVLHLCKDGHGFLVNISKEQHVFIGSYFEGVRDRC